MRPVGAYALLATYLASTIVAQFRVNTGATNDVFQPTPPQNFAHSF